jgi:hypothetical protein
MERNNLNSYEHKWFKTFLIAYQLEKSKSTTSCQKRIWSENLYCTSHAVSSLAEGL